jgi:PadR family transcriptional regulator PadR
MGNDLRLSLQALRVLGVFLEQPARGLSGADIWKETKMLSGTLYPILARLERAGWFTVEWEEVDPREAGRPRRRLYRITALGQNKARQALAELAPGAGRLAWNH